MNTILTKHERNLRRESHFLGLTGKKEKSDKTLDSVMLSTKVMNYLLLHYITIVSDFYKTEDEKNPFRYFSGTLNPILSSLIKVKYQTSILEKGFTLSNLRGFWVFTFMFSPPRFEGLSRIELSKKSPDAELIALRTNTSRDFTVIQKQKKQSPCRIIKEIKKKTASRSLEKVQSSKASYN